MNEFHTARNGRREADAIIGAVDIVVHRLGNRGDVDAFAVQPLGIAQRVVTADRHQRIHAQFIQHLQRVRRKIKRAFVVGMRFIFQKSGDFTGAYFAGIGAAGVQKRAARAIDGAHPLLVQRPNIFRNRFGIFGVAIQQAAPAFANAHHFIAFVHRAIDDGLDAGIQSGHIAAARQHTNPFHRVSPCGPSADGDSLVSAAESAATRPAVISISCVYLIGNTA